LNVVFTVAPEQSGSSGLQFVALVLAVRFPLSAFRISSFLLMNRICRQLGAQMHGRFMRQGRGCGEERR
jgi:hypothetical protein